MSADARETDNCIRANPVPAVLTALGIGFAIGLLTRYVEDLSVDDTAKALRIRPGTVKSLVSRAIEELRRREDEDGTR